MTNLLPAPGLGRESIKSLLDRAMAEELGLFIEGAGSVRAFEMQVSRFKAIYPNQYSSLGIYIPSIPNTILLVKKSVELSD